MDKKKLHRFLDQKVRQYNNTSFIARDPIAIPHRFSKRSDIEIAGFFAATFSWGNRTTILNKSIELFQLFDHTPHAFITQHRQTDLKKLLTFRHRTFQSIDLLYFIQFLRQHYAQHASLESAFCRSNGNLEDRLNAFHHYFFSLPDSPERTRKHVSSPQRRSTCKRLNMFLRWMVRKDGNGVDFGLWKKIQPAELICPIDVHVSRVARKLGLVERKQTDWQTAVELTESLKRLDPTDPVKYDFALFSLGVNEKF
ncbi:MAG: TIGR02757 family protein [Bacteroidetes bacterium]|nr:TIGR02757 family protein [Bacteroidota bacterium]